MQNESDPTECWLPIPGFSSYEASNLGGVRRMQMNGKYRILKGKIDRIGYRQIGLIRDGKQHWFMHHRVIAATFLDQKALEPPARGWLTVNHKNRVKTDNRLENLELVTMKENHRHWHRGNGLHDMLTA